tara:strand:+ start:2466 stop:2663 length:198 start_codon:yes stop_codon:yes gene_type:complete
MEFHCLCARVEEEKQWFLRFSLMNQHGKRAGFTVVPICPVYGGSIWMHPADIWNPLARAHLASEK